MQAFEANISKKSENKIVVNTLIRNIFKKARKRFRRDMVRHTVKGAENL